jgi:hypothetical protein
MFSETGHVLKYSKRTLLLQQKKPCFYSKKNPAFTAKKTLLLQQKNPAILQSIRL